MNLASTLKLCKKYGVTQFKCKDFELHLGTEVSEEKPKPKKFTMTEQDKIPIQGLPTEDEFLYMSSPHYDVLQAEKELK